MNTLPEITYNTQGEIGPQQRRFLILWLLQRLAFVVVPMVLAASWFSGTLWEWFFGIGATVLASGVVWTYGLDIWQNQTQVAGGYLRKFRKRVRGPAHYYVVVDGVQVRAQKEVWQILEAGRPYEVYYSPRSKWLLSYRSIAANTNALK
jgi:hypothetical protein